MRVGFIGYGHMGAAIGHALHQHLGCGIQAVEIDLNRQNVVSHTFPYVTWGTLDQVMADCDIVFCAVKPQQLKSLNVKHAITEKHVVISLMAGVTLSTCSQVFSPASVVRIMPNTPAAVLRGVTGVCFDSTVSQKNKLRVIKLCNSFGATFELKNEGDMNAITALSGSGPAFFYRMVGAFIAFGKAQGLDAGMVHQIAIETMAGASEMLAHDPNWNHQIQRVASPHGTTEAGLNCMDKLQFDGVIGSVLQASYERSITIERETQC
jgi:pyrroline-5-carboxylate reductase